MRDIEEEIVPVCELKGLGIVVWSPLGGGFLSGKYQPGETSRAGARSAEGWGFPLRYFAANRDEILASLLETAAGLGRSPAQVALRWYSISVSSQARSLGHARCNSCRTTLRLPAGDCRTKHERPWIGSPHHRPVTRGRWSRTCTREGTMR